jgi:hypothetical protein
VREQADRPLAVRGAYQGFESPSPFGDAPLDPVVACAVMSTPDILRLIAIVATFWALGAVPIAVICGLQARGVAIRAPTTLLLLLIELQLAGGIVAMIDNLGEPFAWYGSPRYMLAAMLATAFLVVSRRRWRRARRPGRAPAARAQQAR